VEEEALRSCARLVGRIGDHRVEQRIDFEVTIESAGGDGFFRAHFPFAYDGRIAVDIPFGVEDRDVAGEPYGSSTGIFFLFQTLLINRKKSGGSSIMRTEPNFTS